ncbi:MAG: MFS transporter, partial [Oligoflexales bacterium]|nr:MFS transporter [Oligoflexales bacterium]
CALISGGIILHHFSADPVQRLTVFSLLFTFAALARVFSLSCLARQSEPEKVVIPGCSFNALTRWISQKQVIALLVFSFITSLSVHTSGPFFNPFMLKELSLDFSRYSMLLGISFLSKSLTLLVLNRFMTRSSVHWMFLFGAVGIIPLPYFWTISDSFEFLFAVQIVSGIMWGCHELGLSIYLFEHMEHSERSRLLGWTNFSNAMGMMIGVGVGLALTSSHEFGAKFSRGDYHNIFFYSTILRLLPLMLLPGFVREIPFRPLYFRALTIRPNALGILRPLLHLPLDSEADPSRSCHKGGQDENSACKEKGTEAVAVRISK